MMDISLAQPSPVRRILRRWAIRSLVILVPMALWSTWDYAEARRAARLAEAIKAQGEPVAGARAGGTHPAEPNAARFYEAAAAVMADGALTDDVLRRLDVADELDPAVSAQIRTWLDRNRDAEALLARATAIAAYQGSRDDPRRIGDLFSLARIPQMRAIERIQADDPDGAIEALIQQLLISHRLQDPPSDIGLLTAATVFGRAARTLPRILERRPDMHADDRLRAVLEQADRDDIIEQALLSERAVLLSRYWNAERGWFAYLPAGPWGAPGPGLFWLALRPYTSHLLTAQVQMMTAWLESARKPWPDRLISGSPPAQRPAGGPRRFLPMPGETRQEALDRHVRRTKYAAMLLAVVRTTRAALAVEGYRRSHGAALPVALDSLAPDELPGVPIDPFSGKPLLYKATADGYVVYSVGPNRRDDGGESVGTQLRRRWEGGRLAEQPPDIGLRIRSSPAPAPAAAPR